jgi:hypothetical protein
MATYHGSMDIGPPPEFGRDGSPPPLLSAPVNIADWNLDESVAEFLHPRKTEEILSGMPLLADFLVAFGRLTGILPERQAKKMPQENTREATTMKRVRRETERVGLNPRMVRNWQLYAVHDKFWQREDPVTQLPPGSSSEITVSLLIGISEERATELARSLGVTGTVPHVGISSTLSDKASSKIAVSREREVTRKIILTNPQDRTYRRLAIWHVVHRVSLVAMPDPVSDQEIVCEEDEFILSDAANVTFTDVSRP